MLVPIRMIQFLRKLGINEDILQLVVQNGIGDKTQEMLKDLEYKETEEVEHPGMKEAMMCQRSLTILEPNALKDFSCTSTCDSTLQSVCVQSLSKLKLTNTKYSQVNVGSISEQLTCSCYPHLPQDMTLPSQPVVQRNDYLRQTVMIPLAWAMGRALRYKPSDPKHYIACQLLRWKYGNIPECEMNEIRKIIVGSTFKKDQKYREKICEQEKDLLDKLNEEAMKDIPCKICIENQQLVRNKKHCWKCIKKWGTKYEPYELSESSGFHGLSLLDIYESDTSTFDDREINQKHVSLKKKSKVQENKSVNDSMYSYENNEVMEELRKPRYAEKNQVDKEKHRATDNPCCPLPCNIPNIKKSLLKFTSTMIPVQLEDLNSSKHSFNENSDHDNNQ
ncbi:uncharacterized protein LOC105694726 isoform X2 [Orussus abietinus]|uniref:uncharacterized protein LOC105694726 isoform X2 n=1 Tax=Orussus abietinus TaxID=222816 RepID=UPI0006253EC1|nr:uncharacterized protein LOC105694726 isoform X2 [Orussus abietinus]